MRGDPRTIDDLTTVDSEEDDDDWMPPPSDADIGKGGNNHTGVHKCSCMGLGNLTFAFLKNYSSVSYSCQTVTLI